MNAVAVATDFSFEGFAVRVIDRDDGLWFVARDVAALLQYRMASDLTRLLDDDEKGTHIVRTLGGEQELLVISEPGLYRAVIQRRSSQKMDAKFQDQLVRFQRWVFHDVLPAIRSSGSYGAAAPPVDLNDPLVLRGLLASYADKALELQKEVDQLRPSQMALERISVADGSLCITDAAKALQMQPKEFFARLQRNGWIFKRRGSSTYLGYESKVLAGYLEHKVTAVPRSDGSEKMVEQVRITPKGLTKIASLISRH